MTAEQPEVTRFRYGALAGFVALTAFTALIATALGSLKYGVLNWLGLIAGLILIYLLALAFPQLKANWSYLRPRLGKWHLMWYGIYVESLLDGWSILRLGPELLIGLYLPLLCPIANDQECSPTLTFA
jgi:hypothetical protein